MRRAAKVDANHHEILKALRQVGAQVFDTSAVGNGFPDAVCLFRGEVFLVEIKQGKYWKLTPAELVFHEGWAEGPVHIVESIEDALRMIGAI